MTSHGLIPSQRQAYVQCSLLLDDLSCRLNSQSLRRIQESDEVTEFSVRDISVTILQSSPEPTRVSDRSSATDLVNVNFSAIASMGLESKIIMILLCYLIIATVIANITFRDRGQISGDSPSHTKNIVTQLFN